MHTRWTPALWMAAVLYASAITGVSLHAGQDVTTPPTSLANALPANATGEEIFRLTCAACHAANGAGAPQHVVGFPVPLPNGHTLPDFTDCSTNTAEPMGDWMAVVHRGGPVRALDRHMPAFGDALSDDQIETVVRYLWSFCEDQTWPRGDLNLPRALFTEKAFPENETVWTMGVTGAGAKVVTNQLLYEHRLGARGQYEIAVPFNMQQQDSGGQWHRGYGDIEIALRRTFYADLDRGSIFAAGAGVTLPTGSRDEGLGNGFAIYEPFAMWGQILGTNGFLQIHTGLEIPSNHDRGENEAFARTAVGYTLARDGGFGRTWSPMAEVLLARSAGASAEWDIVPQVQVSLSKLQHVLLDVGVRIPLNERDNRKPQLLVYVLWDWASEEIQDECAACHMPMTRRIAQAAGGKGAVFAHLPIDGNADSALRALAADGTSCTVCHQIAPDTLGTRESFNANFVMRPTPSDGARVIFGPHLIDGGRKTIMRSATGFVQAEAPHIRQSELCASCHTLITRARGPRGNVIGSFPEQMNYQEWLHSDFNKEQRSCQSCHMPAAPGPIRIASVLGDVRDRLARHVFVGGNAYMLRLLNRYRAELGVVALPSELEATANATIRFLQEETATVAVSAPRLENGRLSFDVDVRNLSGHKLPTGYPSRRVWLHVTVRDGRGTVAFESGALDKAGAIDGNDNDRDPLAFEPHYDELTRADQVQIYESIPGDPQGKPTTGLLIATQYLKDNRLLPRGFDKTTADREIAVYGDAVGDATFTGSGDRVRYLVDVPTTGAYSVHVELRYQAISHRWAHNLRKYDAPEPQRFLSYYEATAAESSVIVATAARW